MSDERLREFLEVQAHFRLPSPLFVEKDFHIVRALVAIAGIGAAAGSPAPALTPDVIQQLLARAG